MTASRPSACAVRIRMGCACAAELDAQNKARLSQMIRCRIMFKRLEASKLGRPQPELWRERRGHVGGL